jgi:energy-coupling factor transporter ATP-binding protein EcfA2
MSEVLNRLKLLRRQLDPDRPLEDLRLYVEADRSPSRHIADRLIDDPVEISKYLLVGARGGGKSTELRHLARLLEEAKSHTVALVDLDAAGITASSVTAFDLLYLCSVALLRPITDRTRAGELFKRLKEAYAREERERASELGTLAEALDGLGSFAAAVGELAVDSVAPGLGKTLATAAKGIRLLPKGDLVPESSPAGHHLLVVCTEIVQALRRERTLPLCVLLDGLEKMNGEANERFKHIFEETRLLAEAPFTLVAAAPPSTLTHVDSVVNVGYQTVPVWGFPNAPEAMDTLIQQRFRGVELNPEIMPAAQRSPLIAACGGLPRHLIYMLRETVLAARLGKSVTITQAHVEAGIQALGEELARGVHQDHVRLLRQVDKDGQLFKDPDGFIPALFASGRILAQPPEHRTLIIRYVAHPLIKRAFFSDTAS